MFFLIIWVILFATFFFSNMSDTFSVILFSSNDNPLILAIFASFIFTFIIRLLYVIVKRLFTSRNKSSFMSDLFDMDFGDVGGDGSSGDGGCGGGCGGGGD